MIKYVKLNFLNKSPSSLPISFSKNNENDFLLNEYYNSLINKKAQKVLLYNQVHNYFLTKKLYGNSGFRSSSLGKLPKIFQTSQKIIRDFQNKAEKELNQIENEENNKVCNKAVNTDKKDLEDKNYKCCTNKLIKKHLSKEHLSKEKQKGEKSNSKNKQNLIEQIIAKAKDKNRIRNYAFHKLVQSFEVIKNKDKNIIDKQNLGSEKICLINDIKDGHLNNNDHLNFVNNENNPNNIQKESSIQIGFDNPLNSVISSPVILLIPKNLEYSENEGNKSPIVSHEFHASKRIIKKSSSCCCIKGKNIPNDINKKKSQNFSIKEIN